jgi:multiple antibiotic resistance protein
MRLFGEVLVTMLVILDPPGNVPIFLAVTQRLSDKERHRAAFMAVGTAFFVISMFAIGGRTVLDYLHVSVPALQGAGGLLLLLVALQLLYGNGNTEDNYEVASPEQRTSVAMVPLGTPLLAGPGAIVATIVFFGKADGAVEWFSVLLAIACALSVSLITLRFSGVVKKVFRPAGVVLLARVAGMLLAAIAVQMIADSVTSFAHAGTTWKVTKVIDGDTFEVSSNFGDKEKVRPIGIDTPEQGELCFKEAGAKLSALILNKNVDLVASTSTENRERNGRLLRYVEIDGQDVGLQMITDGWAVAAYDSQTTGKTKYKWHEREDLYRSEDEKQLAKICS